MISKCVCGGPAALLFGRARRWVLLIAAGGLFGGSIQAHDCGPPVLTLKSGESCTWTITADRLETSTTYTPLSLTGPAGVALITPFAPFDSKHGVFTINGQTPGTNTFKVHWSYPGTGAAADCTVEIRVTEASPNVNDQSVVREGSLSTWDGKVSFAPRFCGMPLITT